MCIYNEFQASLFYQKDTNSNSVLMCAGASSYMVKFLAKIGHWLHLFHMCKYVSEKAITFVLLYIFS